MAEIHERWPIVDSPSRSPRTRARPDEQQVSGGSRVDYRIPSPGGMCEGTIRNQAVPSPVDALVSDAPILRRPAMHAVRRSFPASRSLRDRRAASRPCAAREHRVHRLVNLVALIGERSAGRIAQDTPRRTPSVRWRADPLRASPNRTFRTHTLARSGLTIPRSTAWRTAALGRGSARKSPATHPASRFAASGGKRSAPRR